MLSTTSRWLITRLTSTLTGSILFAAPLHLSSAMASGIAYPEAKIGSLAKAAPLTCINTSFESVQGGKATFVQRRMTRSVRPRTLGGKTVYAFIYTLDTHAGQERKPNERINYVMQGSDGTILSLAHNDGVDGKRGHYAITGQSIKFPGDLYIGKSWRGDSPLVPDSDITESIVSGVMIVNGKPGWVITSTLLKGNDSLKQMKSVYVLNPTDLGIYWLKAFGEGTREGRPFILSFDSECHP